MASRVEHVYTRLRENILNGSYEQGAPLREKELASNHGTSRTPVREALSQLLAEGLVERVPGRGYFVSRSTVRDLRDTFEVRVVIEGEAAARAAERANDREKKRLRELADFAFEVNDRRSYQRAMERNTQFHLRLAEASGNALIADLVTTCLSRTARFLALGGHIIQEAEQSHHEHHEIVDAIEAGNGKRARAGVRQHLVRTQKLLLGALLGTGGGEV